jgi:SAM-dependent methyltransferase
MQEAPRQHAAAEGGDAGTVRVAPPSLPEHPDVANGRRDPAGEGAVPERVVPADLESAFYDYLGFPEADNRACQTIYADRFAGCGLVLDLACGRGEFLSLLAERGIPGLGVDSDTGMIRQVRERGLEVVEADALAYLELDAPLFDGIYCAHFVEHLGPAELLHLLGRVRRRLRPGGRLIVATPNAACLHTQLVEFWRDLTHVRPYTLELLRFLLSYTGFSVVEAGVNPLRLLPREPLAPLAEEARREVLGAEQEIRGRARAGAASSLPPPPAPPESAAASAVLAARAALRQARDRVTGTATAVQELRHAVDRLERHVGALEERLAGADHDTLRLAGAVRALQQAVGEGTRQLDSLFPSPEIFVIGVRTEGEDAPGTGD